MPENKIITSRRFFIFGLVGGLVAVSSYNLPIVQKWKRSALTTKHAKGNPLSTDVLINKTALNTVALFIGSYFGKKLTAEDRTELIERMAFAAKNDSTYLREYEALHKHLIAKAKKNNLNDFTEAGYMLKEKIVAEFLEKNINSPLSKVHALFSQTERNHPSLLVSTMPHLKRIYSHSGVPWRHRGYSSWPGVPGDPREYARPGAGLLC